jgi:putative aldouronate transport system permease protein
VTDLAPLTAQKKKRRVLTPTNVVLYLMFLAPLIYYVVFHYIPMVGVVIAFADYRMSGFREWVGFKNFRFIFNLAFFWKSFWNTWFFVLLRYIFVFPAPIILALLMNEIRVGWAKKTVQTVSTLPHFLTWVIVGGIWMSLLSPSTGYINQVIKALGGKPYFFMADAQLFPWLFTFLRIWKEVGFGTIIFLAALAGISPELYESAVMDGASRWQQTIHITLPSIMQVILVVFVLSFTGVLNLFEPIYVLRNPHIQSTAEVLDTYVYDMGIVQARYSYATAVGLFKSSISLVMVLFANFLSRRFTEDKRGIL